MKGLSRLDAQQDIVECSQLINFFGDGLGKSLCDLLYEQQIFHFYVSEGQSSVVEVVVLSDKKELLKRQIDALEIPNFSLQLVSRERKGLSEKEGSPICILQITFKSSFFGYGYLAWNPFSNL